MNFRKALVNGKAPTGPYMPTNASISRVFSRRLPAAGLVRAASALSWRLADSLLAKVPGSLQRLPPSHRPASAGAADTAPPNMKSWIPAIALALGNALAAETTTPDDEARFLAGLPVNHPELQSLTTEGAWQQHRRVV